MIVAIFAAKSSARFGTPTLLLFLIVGMLFGSDGLGIHFNSADSVQFIGMLALSVILFSGGMDTKYSEIKPVMKEGVVLATLGVLMTAVLTGVFIYWVCGWFGINFTFTESLLLASVMSSTDSASVFSILRSKKQGLSQNLRPLLELESGSNDPMAYILTVILMQFVMSGDADVWNSILMFVLQMSVGFASGFVLGKLAVFVLNKIKLGNKSLYSILLLALVYFIFSFTDLVGGNGYLAVYIAGLIVGNSKVVFQKSLTTFFDGYTWLFQIVMFISLGLLVNPNELIDVAEISFVIGIFMLIVARPLSVLISLLPLRKVDFKGKLYVSWVGLRGAVPIIFAIYVLVGGVEKGSMIFNIVFVITIMSLLIQGTTVSRMANLLGLSVKLREDSFSGVDIPDEISASLVERNIDPKWLDYGNKLKDIPFDDKTLVMMLRRGDDYIVPKGDTEIMLDDKILCIIGDSNELPSDYISPRRKRITGLTERRNARLKRLVGKEGPEAADELILMDEVGMDDYGADSGIDDEYSRTVASDPRFDEDIMDDNTDDAPSEVDSDKTVS